MIRTLIALAAGADANVIAIAPLDPLATSAITVSPVETSINWIINWVLSAPSPWFLWGADAPEFNKFIVVADALPIVVVNCLAVMSVVRAIVPELSGKATVLSAVGSPPVSFISKSLAVVPSNSIVLFSTTFTVSFNVVCVPTTVKLPVTVKLSLTVTSDVVWPILTGTPEVAVPIVIPLKYWNYLYLM